MNLKIMNDPLPSLQDCADYGLQISTARALPEILPRFYIPALQDKPQNPIVDGLKFLSFKPSSFHPASQLPPELAVIIQDTGSIRATEELSEALWVKAVRTCEDRVSVW